MKILNIEGKDSPKHYCRSHQKGDWLIFECSNCNYQRKRNWRTGEMQTSGGGLGTLHSGFHVPAEKQHLQYVPN